MGQIRDRRKPGWFWMTNEFLDDYGAKIGPYGIAVYAALCRLADNGTQKTAPTVKLLSLKTGISDHKIRAVLRELADLGLIEIGERMSDEGDRTSNEYFLLDCPTETEVLHSKEDGPPQQGGRSSTTCTLIEQDSSYQDGFHQDSSSTCGNGEFKHFEWGTIQSLVSLYNEGSPDELAAVQVLGNGRAKRAKELLHRFPEREFWEECMKQMHASHFLRGLRPKPGHEHWKADFDWLLGQKDGIENCVRLHDGRYHD